MRVVWKDFSSDPIAHSAIRPVPVSPVATPPKREIRVAVPWGSRLQGPVTAGPRHNVDGQTCTNSQHRWACGLHIFLSPNVVGPDRTHPPISSMSALSDASTPAQDGAPPSIDTQQLQQQQLTNDLQAQNNSTTSSENVRKRTVSYSSIPFLTLILYLQPKLLQSVEHAPLAMPVKRDAAKSFRVK